MSLARYLSKLGALLNSSGQVGASGLQDSGVTAGTYGSASAIPAITVDAKGRVTSASESAFSSSYVGGKGQVFTSSGTFTIPAGVTAVKAIVIGGGGGGGSAGTTGGTGGGGAAGGMAVRYLTGLTPAATITVTIGNGGTTTSANTTGGTGGTSSISSGTQSITTTSATGGAGGGSAAATSTALGGTSSGGSLNSSGYLRISNISTGADGYYGAGGRGKYANTNSSTATGQAGQYGSGGGGGGSYVAGCCWAAASGGVGGAGLVIFEW